MLLAYSEDYLVLSLCLIHQLVDWKVMVGDNPDVLPLLSLGKILYHLRHFYYPKKGFVVFVRCPLVTKQFNCQCIAGKTRHPTMEAYKIMGRNQSRLLQSEALPDREAVIYKLTTAIA